MPRTRTFGLAALVVAAAIVVVAVQLDGGDATGATAPDRQARIRNALAAAPAEVVAKAAVADWPEEHGGEMPMLREGDNGWTCLPNDPMTPTDDPQCLDGNAMAWMEAWMAHRPPQLEGPGMAYVLQGCTVASNTDPFAMEPADGDHWVEAPPHVMIFPAGPLEPAPWGTDPARGMPYVRWAGTPYAHLVIPV